MGQLRETRGENDPTICNRGIFQPWLKIDARGGVEPSNDGEISHRKKCGGVGAVKSTGFARGK